MRAVSASFFLGVAAAKSFIAVNRSCTDPSTGCNGGCYQWEDDADFFGNCMQGKSPAVGILMPDLVTATGDCAELGFTPLTQAPYGTPIPGGSSAPDRCYGESGTRVSFFVTDQKWVWDDAVTGLTPNGFDPVPACIQWQADNPQCFDQALEMKQCETGCRDVCNQPFTAGGPDCCAACGCPRDDCPAPVALEVKQCETGCRDVCNQPFTAGGPDCCAACGCPRDDCPVPVASEVKQCETGCRDVCNQPFTAGGPDCCAACGCPRDDCPAPLLVV